MKAFDIHNDDRIDADLRQLIPKNMARQYGVVPKEVASNGLHLYIKSDQEHDQARRYLKVFLGKDVILETVEPGLIDLAHSRFYGSNGQSASGYTNKIEKKNFLDQLIFEAIELKASDIHVEKFEQKARVRFRINGHLVERFNVNLDDYPELVNKVKITANLDIAEKRLPQDGRINFNKDTVSLDLRVSVLPTLYGEKVVLRLLEKNATGIQISALGLSERELEVYQEATSKPNGLVLISGPTGSGKTTTLYATLKELNKEDVNIVTVEDPVEYTLPGINQVQLNEKIGLGFPQALRTFLRQDPDIVMVGEIRDTETAQMATRAALTGHLVFSTVHTNSALGIFNRLVEMGVSEYLLADTLNAGVAQRLVRTLCDSCKHEKDASNYAKYLGNRDIKTVFEPVGCVSCLGTGYSGRKAIYEIIPNSPDLFKKIKKSDFDVSEYLKKHGLGSLEDNALLLLKQGTTSFEEVLPFLI